METRAERDRLHSPLQYLKGVGPQLSQKLLKKSLHSIEDLLYFFPRRYEDRREQKAIRDLQVGDRVSFVGKIRRAYPVRFNRSRHSSYELQLEDLETGRSVVKLRWFHRPFQWADFKTGWYMRAYGEVKNYRSALQVVHPEFEVLGREMDGEAFIPQILPVYSSTDGLYQKTLRKICRNALETCGDDLRDLLPEELLSRENFPSLKEALWQLHQPPLTSEIADLLEEKTPAHQRFIYEELFLFSLEMAIHRRSYLDQVGFSFRRPDALWEKFKTRLPFRFTEDQRRVLSEILADMERNRMMHRLLQGDVGSGKTVVAAAASLIAIESGKQVALMAPTEVLAEQHYEKFIDWMKDLPLSVWLLTGSSSKDRRRTLLADLKAGKPGVLIGTHALLEDNVEFSDLGLVIIDEQHRFGVRQRAKLLEKGTRPDLLVMTATPIPRSLALTLYGDLDFSLLKQKPPGRQIIRTESHAEKNRKKVESEVESELKAGRRAYWIFPLIEESDTLDLRDILEFGPRLQKRFSGFSVGILHGRMSSAEKSKILQDFARGKIQLLASTTVVEVGVNVPEATVMVIENAERFGLSQLHQLRGRVGRGKEASSCHLMMSAGVGDKQKKRLQAMETSDDGFELAELDLSLRGPGDFRGTKQAGLPQFRLANLVRDREWMQRAKEDAEQLVLQDPELKNYPDLRARVKQDLQSSFLH